MARVVEELEEQRHAAGQMQAAAHQGYHGNQGYFQETSGHWAAAATREGPRPDLGSGEPRLTTAHP